eukprot:CAMPEP_0171045508 /NCGR_PEP_ID=MMETSP0736-20130129/48760_1 /TAXON_ID=186038 /ORGANISM="Fragilariopsis kerguelensis, Strain L26-C5" /LENGTH=78 /DNA_ID=CAMNT_0011495929 /DNA_START=208 /DNA_END=440 /DNA_ORIENTATION=+
MYRNSSMSNTDDTDNTTKNDFLSKSKDTFERNKLEGSVTVAMVGFSTPTRLSVSVLTFPPDMIPVHQLSGSSSSSSSS